MKFLKKNWLWIVIAVIIIIVIVALALKAKKERDAKKLAEEKAKLIESQEIKDLKDTIDKQVEIIEEQEEEISVTKKYLSEESSNLSDKRKQQIIDLTAETYVAIYTPNFNSGEQIGKLNVLSDPELYLSTVVYKLISKGNSLYEDVDDEILPLTRNDERLLKRLRELELVS